MEQRLIRSQSVVKRVAGDETLIVAVRSRVGDLGSIYSFMELEVSSGS